MGRLTGRYYDVTNDIWHWSIKSNSTNDGLVATPQDILDKLAHYEDLEEQLMESAEIDIDSMVGEFMHYYNLQKENRLIELPCAVGDTVWRIIEMSTGKTLNRNGATVNPTIKRFIKPVKVTKNNLLDICETYGKKVFPTKEEAERKLEGLKGE